MASTCSLTSGFRDKSPLNTAPKKVRQWFQSTSSVWVGTKHMISEQKQDNNSSAQIARPFLKSASPTLKLNTLNTWGFTSRSYWYSSFCSESTNGSPNQYDRPCHACASPKGSITVAWRFFGIFVSSSVAQHNSGVGFQSTVTLKCPPEVLTWQL